MSLTTLKEVITEIAYRVVSEVGVDHGITTSTSIANIAEPLADKIMEQIALQGDPRFRVTFQAIDLETYELFCAILDGIQKEIPVVSRMNVTVSLSRLKGSHATTATDSGTGGDPSGLVP